MWNFSEKKKKIKSTACFPQWLTQCENWQSKWLRPLLSMFTAEPQWHLGFGSGDSVLSEKWGIISDWWILHSPALHYFFEPQWHGWYSLYAKRLLCMCAMCQWSIWFWSLFIDLLYQQTLKVKVKSCATNQVLFSMTILLWKQDNWDKLIIVPLNSRKLFVCLSVFHSILK